jgi:hypothetical protein
MTIITKRYHMTVASRYIPKGATKVCDKLSDAIAYLYTAKNGKPGAIVYYGNQSKPVEFCYYQNEQRRAINVTQAFKNRRETMSWKAEAQAKRKAWVNDYKVGDLLRTCWGYDQTNVEYYEVVELKGKHVMLREIMQKRVETASMQGNCVPLPGQYRGEAFRKLAQESGVRISSCQWASRETPKMIAGVPVYDPAHWSSYA